MKILHISASHANESLHAFSFHFKNVARAMGHDVVSISPYTDGLVVKGIDFRFGNESFRNYYIGKQLFPLSRILRNYPESDFIFIENPKFPFDNDVDIPVVYYHRDMKCKSYVPNADFFVLRFWSFGKTKDGRPKGGQPELMELYHPEIWYDDAIKKIWLCHAISTEEFDKFNKYKKLSRTKQGFAYFGSYKSVNDMMRFNNVHYQIYCHHSQIIQFVNDNKLASEFREINESLDAYKKHLFEFDATLIIPAWDSWETRRLYEASFCKCVPIVYIQNENARKVFKAQGYINGKTCITFDNLTELHGLNIYDYNLDTIREQGYEMVKTRHTYKARVQELFNKIDTDNIETKNILRKLLNNHTEPSQVIKKLEEINNRVTF